MRGSLVLAVIAALVLVACSQDHHVELSLGSGSSYGDVSAGFKCTKADGVTPLFSDAAQTVNGQTTYRFEVVVDMIEYLHGFVPVCIPEYLVDACTMPGCSVLMPRACTFVDVTVAQNAGGQAIVTAIEDALHAQASQLIADAPSTPVMIRIVAARLTAGGDSDAACTALAQTDGGFNGYEVLGCAYSCVYPLQSVSTIEVGLDVSNDSSSTCIQEVDACANFPPMP